MTQIASMKDRPCAIKDRIRELEGQLDETLQSLRMEKALVSGELHEEENMLEIERAQLENNVCGARNNEISKELEMTLRDRKRRMDALKVSTAGNDNYGKTRWIFTTRHLLRA